MASYQGTESTESIQEILGDRIGRKQNRGYCGRYYRYRKYVDNIDRRAKKQHPREIKIATLFLKPGALKYNLRPDYVAMNCLPILLWIWVGL